MARNTVLTQRQREQMMAFPHPDETRLIARGSSGLCVVNIYSAIKPMYLSWISPFFRTFSRQNCKFSKLPREIPKSRIFS